MGRQRASIFQETVTNYLRIIAQYKWQPLAARLAIRVDNGCLTISFFNQNYYVFPDKITDHFGNQPSHSICVVLCRYIIQGCETNHPSYQSQLVTYKDFKDAAPFVGGFANFVHKPIISRFSNRQSELRTACLRLGAKSYNCQANCEVSVMFPAFPKVPVHLIFSDADEEFDAHCTVLFRRDANQYLDMECLAIVGDQLATRLIDKDH